MIQVEPKPFSDTEAKTISEWLNHPGRLLYQKFLAGQAAEKMVEAENMRMTDEAAHDPDNSLKPEADLISIQAKVLRAANKHFDQVVAKDFKFYTVELKPEPTTQ